MFPLICVMSMCSFWLSCIFYFFSDLPISQVHRPTRALKLNETVFCSLLLFWSTWSLIQRFAQFCCLFFVFFFNALSLDFEMSENALLSLGKQYKVPICACSGKDTLNDFDLTFRFLRNSPGRQIVGWFYLKLLAMIAYFSHILG